ncbi:hypothetical protein DH2020_026683 [Rehmannia glutinosa]|uniref:Protein kinase domain-containing protein n=1 Tax=Rehmannia glutinosa TaxID=99300 RepID=A0ABR0VWC9_REHGL
MVNSTIAQWLIFFIFFYFTSNPATSSNNETDLLALLAFKDNTIDPKGALDLWNLSNGTVHFCSWKGISCGNKHRNRVVSINLDSQGLMGSISPHLGNLSFLRSISLRNNSFHGPIPQELGRLRRLGYIEFSNNSSSGEIPKNLSQCRNLHYLNLIDNELTGIIPSELSSLIKLDALGLSDNNLSGNTIPPFFGNFTLLIVLSLSNCGLHGYIPESLVHLRNLKQLILDTNQLTGEIPFLQGNIPFDIGSTLPKLRNLGLGDNNFSGVLPVSLSNASSLRFVGLFANSFTGPMPKNLDRLLDLRFLSIWSTNIEDDISFISSLTNCTRLTVVDIFDNMLTGSLPVTIANLTTQLRKLTIGINHIRGTIPSGIGNLIGLNTLSLQLNLLSGPIPSTIGKLFKMQEINLSANRFTNELPSSLGNLTLLNILYATRNNFSGSIPQSLANFSRLLVLDLSVNNFSGVIPREIMSISSLSIYLDLSYNALFGSVPSEVGLLRDLSDLDLSHNRLSGIFPNTIRGCISLQRLHLDGNCVYRRNTSGLECFERNNLYDSSFESQFKKLSYADLLKATNGFSEANVIGSGRFSTVYKGVLEDGPSETVVAVKVLKLNIRGAQKSFLSECNALRGARHRNLLKILSISLSIDFRGNDFTALIYQFKANGSLENWLHQNENMDRYLRLMQRLNIAIDVACAVEYLHSGTGSDIIVHGDLKPSNILLDDDMTAHVGDFGLAKVMSNIPSGFAAGESSSIAVTGTIGYIAPEYGMAGTVSTKGDVYSYGILLLELFTNVRPISDTLLSEYANLHNFVANSLPDRAMEIADPLIVLKEGHIVLTTNFGDCLASVLGIGVACSRELSQDRISITDVFIELNKIRIKCLALGLN